MSDDLAFQVCKVQSQLIEIKEELGKIQKENNELKYQIAANNFMKTVDDHAKLSETVGAMQANFNTLSARVSSSDQMLSKINETLKKQNQTLIGQHKNLEKLNKASKTLKTTSNKDGVLSKVNETLEKQNKDIQVLKKNIKTMEKETILLLGGRSGNEAVDSLLILQNDGEDDEGWKQLNIRLPHAVWCHGAQFLDNYLYIFGGQNEKNEVLNLSYKLTRGHKWITNSLQWEKMVDMNEKRTYISNSSVILNGRIWVIGGCNEKNQALRSVEMYDPQTNIWTNKKEMNECRGLSAAAVVRGKIFCCGGETGGDYSKTTECYDPSSDVWTLISDMPGPNGECGTVVMDGHLIVIGGSSNPKNFSKSVWVLDTTDRDGKWVGKKPRLPRPLCEFSIAKIHDQIFVCGGLYISEKDSLPHTTSEVKIFDGEEWRNGPTMPTYLDNAQAVVIPMEFARSLS